MSWSLLICNIATTLTKAAESCLLSWDRLLHYLVAMRQKSENKPRFFGSLVPQGGVVVMKPACDVRREAPDQGPAMQDWPVLALGCSARG